MAIKKVYPAGYDGLSCVVLELLSEGREPHKNRYRIRNKCCGAEEEKTGIQIYNKELKAGINKRQKRPLVCRHCQKRPITGSAPAIIPPSLHAWAHGLMNKGVSHG